MFLIFPRYGHCKSKTFATFFFNVWKDSSAKKQISTFSRSFWGRGLGCENVVYTGMERAFAHVSIIAVRGRGLMAIQRATGGQADEQATRWRPAHRREICQHSATGLKTGLDGIVIN